MSGRKSMALRISAYPFIFGGFSLPLTKIDIETQCNTMKPGGKTTDTIDEYDGNRGRTENAGRALRGNV